MLFTDNSWENPFELVDILTNTPDFGLSWLNLVEDMSTQHLDQKTQSKCLQLAQELTPYSETRWTIGTIKSSLVACLVHGPLQIWDEYMWEEQRPVAEESSRIMFVTLTIW